MKLWILVLVMTMIAAAPAAADDTNAEMVDACHETVKHKDDASKDVGKSLWCLGVASGYTNMHDMLVALDKSPAMWCIPDGVTLGQGIKIYVRWTKLNPERLHEPAVMGWTLAMIKAFPCKEAKVQQAPTTPDNDL